MIAVYGGLILLVVWIACVFGAARELPDLLRPTPVWIALPLVLAGTILISGNPRGPLSSEITLALEGESHVIAAKIVEDEAIFVYVDGDPPMSFQIDYSLERALELQEALREDSQGKLIIRWDGEEGGSFQFGRALAPYPPKENNERQAPQPR